MTAKILVFGGWFGSKNVGDDAILIGIKKVFEMTYPGVELTAISTDPEYTKKVCNVNAVDARNIKTIYNLFFNSDLIIISGGTPIYDYDHIYRFYYHFLLPKLAKRKVVYFGISSKVIRSLWGKVLTKIILNRAELITIREPKTEEILRKIGVKKKLILTGDSAFVIEPEATISNVHINKVIGSPMIGICPRILSINFKKHFHDKIDDKSIKNIYQMIAKTADYLIEIGCSVYFIPFHTEHYDDDLKAIKSIINFMSTHDFTILNKYYHPLELLRIIGEMDLIIGMRFHSLVFSAIQNIPMVTVNYDTKIEGLMKLLGLKEFMCKPNDTSDTLISKIEEILNEKKEIRKNLKVRVNTIKKTILMSAQEICNLF